MVFFGEPSLADKIGLLITMVIVLSIFIVVEIKNWLENRKDKVKIELANTCVETEELLTKQIEATYKTAQKLIEAKVIIKNLCGMVRELNKPDVQLTDVDYSLSEAEQFLKEIEND